MFAFCIISKKPIIELIEEWEYSCKIVIYQLVFDYGSWTTQLFISSIKDFFGCTNHQTHWRACQYRILDKMGDSMGHIT